MLRIHSFVLACAGFCSLCHASAATITQDFSSNPFQQDWRIFGDTNLFQWDGSNQNLQVTWDSSKPNSYFYHPLGTILARDDDFSIAFDLRLADIGPGVDTNKAGSFSIGVGFLNSEVASKNNFIRGTGTGSPDLAELAYFWDSGFGATTWPTLVDTNSTFNYNGSSDYAIFALAPGDWYHITMSYTASNQALISTLTNFEHTSGVSLRQVLGTNFTDYRLDSFNISSYSDAGQDPQYAGTVLAHGVVDNIVVKVPTSPVGALVDSRSNGVWRVQFGGRTNWLYSLQRTSDLKSWTDVSAPMLGASGPLTLADTNLNAAGFYRVRATRP